MRKINVLHFRTFEEKTQGLLGYQKAIPVFFTTRFGIHTFGLRFSIDVLILDRQNRIVRLRKNLPPNSVFFWPPIYNQVVELPAGYISRYHITLTTTFPLG